MPLPNDLGNDLAAYEAALPGGTGPPWRRSRFAKRRLACGRGVGSPEDGERDGNETAGKPVRPRAGDSAPHGW